MPSPARSCARIMHERSALPVCAARSLCRLVKRVAPCVCMGKERYKNNYSSMPITALYQMPGALCAGRFAPGQERLWRQPRAPGGAVGACARAGAAPAAGALLTHAAPSNLRHLHGANTEHLRPCKHAQRRWVLERLHDINSDVPRGRQCTCIDAVYRRAGSRLLSAEQSPRLIMRWKCWLCQAGFASCWDHRAVPAICTINTDTTYLHALNKLEELLAPQACSSTFACPSVQKVVMINVLLLQSCLVLSVTACCLGQDAFGACACSSALSGVGKNMPKGSGLAPLSVDALTVVQRAAAVLLIGCFGHVLQSRVPLLAPLCYF